MNTELKLIADFALFARVVQAGGISSCALELGFERTTVSRRISGLEKYLGVRLLERSPKHISVTDAGQRCYEQCAVLLHVSHLALNAATNVDVTSEAQAIVVGAPAEALDSFLIPSLRSFEEITPSIVLEYRPVGSWTNSSVERVDVGIAIGSLSVHGVWQKKLASLPQKLCASPGFIEKVSRLLTPSDLQNCTCIVEQSAEKDRHWHLKKGGEATRITLNQRLQVDSLLEAREAALAGLGICRIPRYMCESYLAAGQLVEVLEGFTPPAKDLFLLSPRQSLPKRGVTMLRLFLDDAFKHDANRIASAIPQCLSQDLG